VGEAIREILVANTDSESVGKERDVRKKN